MKSYEMYIFDLDDTLIHTFREVTKRYYPKFAEIFGITYPGDEVVRQHWGGDLFTSLEKIFDIQIDQTKATEILQRMYRENPINPIAGVNHILNTLRKHGKFIGLYSSGHPSIIDLCIRSSLACKPEDFHFIFSTVEQQIEKPSPHIVFVMMEKYRQLFSKEVGLSQVLVVGDSAADFLMAKNAGADFAAVLTGPTTPDDFLYAGLDTKWIFPSVKEALVSPSNHGVVAIIQNEENEFLLIEDGDPKHEYVGYWSGPHGVCKDEDVLEEETVVRETLEECGITVKPLRKLYTQAADTKVSTVSFWEAELTNQKNVTFKLDPREVREIDWIPYEDIVNCKVPLYPGTKDFFNKYKQIVMKEREVKI